VSGGIQEPAEDARNDEGADEDAHEVQQPSPAAGTRGFSLPPPARRDGGGDLGSAGESGGRGVAAGAVSESNLVMSEAMDDERTADEQLIAALREEIRRGMRDRRAQGHGIHQIRNPRRTCSKRT
jgi:hypothetical protein